MGHEKAIAVFTKPADPAAKGADLFEGLIWLCRPCRHDYLTEADRDAQAERERALEQAKQAEQASKLFAGTSAFAALPPQIQREMAAKAASGPRGLPLRPESPLYQQRLAKLVLEYLERAGSGDSSSSPN
jgi:hypothetical protein